MDQIRAWKDPEYRKSLDSSILPQHPAGLVSLDDDSLDDVAGGTTAICFTISLSVALCSAPFGSCEFGTTGCC